MGRRERKTDDCRRVLLFWTCSWRGSMGISRSWRLFRDNALWSDRFNVCLAMLELMRVVALGSRRAGCSSRGTPTGRWRVVIIIIPAAPSAPVPSFFMVAVVIGPGVTTTAMTAAAAPSPSAAWRIIVTAILRTMSASSPSTAAIRVVIVMMAMVPFAAATATVWTVGHDDLWRSGMIHRHEHRWRDRLLGRGTYLGWLLWEDFHMDRRGGRVGADARRG